MQVEPSMYGVENFRLRSTAPIAKINESQEEEVGLEENEGSAHVQTEILEIARHFPPSAQVCMY